MRILRFFTALALIAAFICLGPAPRRYWEWDETVNGRTVHVRVFGNKLLPGGYLFIDSAAGVYGNIDIYTTPGGGQTYTAPSTWSSTDNKVECVGTGGGGLGGTNSRGGGGGGEYASKTNVTGISPSEQLLLQIANPSTTANTQSSLTALWDDLAGTNVIVLCNGGWVANAGTGGVGGTGGTGTVTHAGGNAGNGVTASGKHTGGGGGGAGGPAAAGGNGANGTGASQSGGGGGGGDNGATGNASGATGGTGANGANGGNGATTSVNAVAGSNGTFWQSSPARGVGGGGGGGSDSASHPSGAAGGNYGGGGGGAGDSSGSAGAGVQGVIVLQWNAGTDYPRSSSDTITGAVYEYVARIFGAVRSPVDPITSNGSESNSRILGANRSAVDASRPVSDLSSRIRGANISAVENISSGESVVRATANSRSVVETFTTFELGAHGTLVTRSGSDQLAPLSEFLSRTKNAVVTSSDSVISIDYSARISSLSRAGTENIITREVVAASRTNLRSGNESIGGGTPSSFSLASDIVRSLTEHTGSFEVASRTRGAVRTGSDSLIATREIASRIRSAVRSGNDSTGGSVPYRVTVASDIVRYLSEQAGSIDTAFRSSGTSRAGNDSLSQANDKASRSLGLPRSQADFVAALNEISSRSQQATRQFNESIVGVNESRTRTLGALRAPSDQVGSSDLSARTYSAQRSLVDSSSISEISSRQVTSVRNFDEFVFDMFSTADSATRAVSNSRSFYDQGLSGDIGSRIYSAPRSASEALLTIREFMATQSGVARFGNDSLGRPADPIARLVAASRSVVESVFSSENGSRVYSAPRSAVDSIGSADISSRVKGLNRSNTDTVQSGDAVSRILALTRSLSESISSVEYVARTYNAPRSVADGLIPFDIGSRSRGTSRSVSESLVGVRDAVVKQASLSRASYETTVIAEAVSRILGASRSVSEAMTAPSDPRSRLYGANRTITEPLASIDVNARSTAVSRQSVENFQLIEIGGRLFAAKRDIIEAVGLGGDYPARNVINHREFFEFVSEAIPVSDKSQGARAPWSPQITREHAIILNGQPTSITLRARDSLFNLIRHATEFIVR